MFLFGIMQSVDSINVSIDAETGTDSSKPGIILSAPAVTSGVDEEGRAVYTYATDLNVLSARKPELADYSRTETMLLIPEEDTETTKPVTTTVPPDFVMQGDDLDYTLPPKTTPVSTTTAETTISAAATTTTTTTAATTTTTPAPAETTSAPTESKEPAVITEVPEDDTDVTDLSDDLDVTLITTETEAPEDTTAESTTTAETTIPETIASKTESTGEPEYLENNEIFSVNAGGTIITDTAVNVVAMAVMGEISDIFDDEAIKAQAIAAYTYVKYYNLNGQNAYIAKSKPSQKVIDLVRQVIGKALYYDGKLIQAVYTASTAGKTASSENVWGVDYPYLRSIDTSFIDKEYDINYGRKVTFTSEEIKQYVRDNAGIELSGDPSGWITIDSYFDDIYVGYMTIGGQKSFMYNGKKTNITGRAFREKILKYNIRSHCFEIEYDADSDIFTITTYGYGHCVGFSQHGANILASKYGYTYDQILKFYYQGVEIR